MRCVKILLISFFAFTFWIINVNAEEIDYDNAIPSILYKSHVQTYGWQGFVNDGIMSGTEGQAKRLEAICLKLNNVNDSGIRYLSHVQTYGWETDWKRNGEISGTEGQAKRLEAVRIQLTGNIAMKYDVYYRAHVQTYGWLDWVKNGEVAGTEGQAKRLEAIEVKLVKKDVPETEKRDPTLNYTSHVQSYGWLESIENGITGTIGEGKRLEAIKVTIDSPDYIGKIYN